MQRHLPLGLLIIRSRTASRPSGKSESALIASQITQMKRIIENGGLVIAMIGSRQFYQPAVEAYRQGCLARFITDLWVPPNPVLSRLNRRLGKSRFNDALCGADVVSTPVIGLAQALGTTVLRRAKWKYAVYSTIGRQFALNCVPHLRTPHRAFLGFTCGSLEAIEHENRSGVFTVLNQIDPGRVEQHIVEEEEKSQRAWLLQPGDKTPDAYFDRVNEEMRIARRVLVNSVWTKSALVRQGIPENKIYICPLAYARRASLPLNRRHPASGKTVKVLWLGTLNLRKGIPYAVQAARILENTNIRFTFAGPLEVALPALPSNSRYIGNIARADVEATYASHDIFILPTLSDGFGLTQVEAMAHGLPVIATACCGDVVKHGTSGLLVPPRDAVALADAILQIANDPYALAAMSHSATVRAADFSPAVVWERYRRCFP